MKKENNEKLWYNNISEEQDVILSTRVRLSRNLASFPFPSNFKIGEDDRVQNIIFDAFIKLPESDSFQIMSLDKIKPNGEKILFERGYYKGKGTGFITTVEGDVGCLINENDHIKISSFVSGLNISDAYEKAKFLDKNLQQYIQYAASLEFGYLNSSVFNTGSGMKITVRMHLPSLSHSAEIKDVIKDVQKKGFVFSDSFGVGNFFDTSLGAYYQVSTNSCLVGNEIDQIAAILSISKYICDLERKKRQFYADNKPTIIRNIVLRAYSMAKFSILLSLRDSIDIISCLKWGIDLGIIEGIQDYELNSLLYSIQSGHLEYLKNNFDISFEDDIIQDDLLVEDRLRSIVIKSEVDKIKFIS